MRHKLSREELFALVWERPTSEIAKELSISDVALAKLCKRLQVPKPPRGYWARIQAGQTPRRPPLDAFLEELENRRRKTERMKAAGALSKLQQQFYGTALADLKAQGIDVQAAELKGGRLPNLTPDLASQLLLLIQNRAKEWIKQGKIDARWSHSLQGCISGLVAKLLPRAQPQLLIFENERRNRWSSDGGPAVLVRLTASLQERIAAFVRIVKDYKLHHVVRPLTSADHTWSTRYIHTPDSHMFLDSFLCVSATEIWIESLRRSWKDESPPERMAQKD